VLDLRDTKLDCDNSTTQVHLILVLFPPQRPPDVTGELVGDGRGGDVIAEVPGGWKMGWNLLVIACMVESLQILVSKSTRVSSLRGFVSFHNGGRMYQRVLLGHG